MAQTVLITGGSRGIGAACVRTFAENGWNTAFTYSKSREAADRLAGETGALALLADQQDTAAVELAVAEGKARFGTIDAVVCNAGIAEQKLFQNITDADWMRMLDVNLMGTVRTIRAVLPDVYKRQAELGQTSCALTDHGVMYGVIDFYRACKAKGIHPVIGCEVYLAPHSRFDRSYINGEWHTPVSCTHLDVYKRQRMCFAAVWRITD